VTFWARYILYQLNSSPQSVDLSAAADLIQNLSASFKENRNETGAFISTLFSKAEEQSKKCDIDPVLTKQRVRKMPRRFSDSAVDETVGHRSEVDTQTTFRQHIYYPVIDCIISELGRRFSDQSLTAMKDIQALTPKHKSFLDYSNIESFALLYNSNVEDPSHEIPQVGRLLQRSGSCKTKMATMLNLACFLEPYKLAFHEMYRLLNIAIVLPVTSAACERRFSALKLIKTYLRSTTCMSDIRLSSLACCRLNLFVQSRLIWMPLWTSLILGTTIANLLFIKC
jgi:hAT family C-terminal dimerisation region